MSRPQLPTYFSNNWHDYNAARAKRGSLSIWFDPETQWLAPPTGRRGRQPVFTDAAIQTCLTMKALFGLSLRQTTVMVTNLLKLAGLDWPVPGFGAYAAPSGATVPFLPSRRVGRRPSSHSARTANHGRSTLLGRPCAKMRFAVAVASVGPSGSDGQATTDEPLPRPRCAASRFWASASCPTALTARLLSFR